MTNKRAVWKFGTGQTIPASGKYLCTQVEKRDEYSYAGNQGDLLKTVSTLNVLVWHYYEVELDEAGNAK